MSHFATRPTGPAVEILDAQKVDYVLTKTVSGRLHHHIVVSLLTGARTEELGALRWDHVHLDAGQVGGRPIAPHIEVWPSVREDGDTKTESRAGRSRCRSSASTPSASNGPSKRPSS